MNEPAHPGLVIFGNLRDTSSFQSLHHFKRKHLTGTGMYFPGQSYPVAQIAQVLNNALPALAGWGMVPAYPVLSRVHTTIQLSAAGGTHRHGKIRLVEGHTLRGQMIDVWGFNIFSTIQGQIIEGTIIGDDNQYIGLLLLICSIGA